MSDHEIQFGELEETQRLQRLRPDRNKQLAVAVCGSPAADDLPIFVDLDALREMETHALSDSSVELGGVLLGGQYEDDAGKPYVVVQDSLRARHYQSSKGSFKFTHDTWSDITRRREEFPSELQMVGWYHTHPDWGVFLSGMDLFICDHFFNRPLDVALVIDPCRGERGWFQWTADPDQRTAKTDGFYLYASRHRQVELELYAAHRKGKDAMAHDPRSGGIGFPGGVYPVTVTTSQDPRSTWLAIGVMGMLGMQFLLLVLVAWRLLVGLPDDVATDRQAASGPAAATPGQLAIEQRVQSELANAQRELLDRVVSALDENSPQGVVSLLEQLRRENEVLQADMRVYRSLEAKTHLENESLARVLEESEQRNASQRKQLAALDQSLRESAARERDLKKQLDRANSASKLADSPDGQQGTETSLLQHLQEWWMWIGGSVLLLILVGLGYMAATMQPGSRQRFAAADDDLRAARPPDSREPGDRDPER